MFEPFVFPFFAVFAYILSPFFFYVVTLSVAEAHWKVFVSCVCPSAFWYYRSASWALSFLPWVFRQSSDMSVDEMPFSPLCLKIGCKWQIKMTLGGKSFIVHCSWGFLASSLTWGRLFPGMFSSILPKAVLDLCILEFSVCFFFPQRNLDPIILTRMDTSLPALHVVRLPTRFHTWLRAFGSYV